MCVCVTCSHDSIGLVLAMLTETLSIFFFFSHFFVGLVLTLAMLTETLSIFFFFLIFL